MDSYKMKIAVYGDSFACNNTRFFPSDDGLKPESNFGSAWIELLEDELGHSVTNFAIPGSAFMYSYEKFLDNYEKFDINIFVVTSPHRLYVKELDGMLLFGADWVDHLEKSVQHKEWYSDKDKHLRILDSIKTYMLDWVDWNMVRHIQHVLVNNLWSLKPNTIVIPAFSNSIQQTSKNLDDGAFYELSMIDSDAYGEYPLGKIKSGKAVVCKRKCHFSAENNYVIFTLIKQALENGRLVIELDKDLLIKPKVADYFYYVGLQELK
jgi:hypothetical protein